MTRESSDHKDLLFLHLTSREGADIYVAASSIFAVEKDPNESFTVVKTVGDTFGVLQSPEVIFKAMVEMMSGTPQEQPDWEQTQALLDGASSHIARPNDRRPSGPIDPNDLLNGD